MTCAFAWKENLVWVTNIVFESINDALTQIAPAEANSKEEHKFVDRYIRKAEGFFPGYVFQLEEFTSDKSELLFWRRCFITLAQKVYNREVGNQEDQTWQIWYISDVLKIAKLMSDAAADLEGKE